MTLQLTLQQRNNIKPFSHSLKALANVYPAIIILLATATTIQWKCLNCYALTLQCPLYQMHLQKIVGFRPPLEYMTASNLFYSPAKSNYKNRNRYTRDGYPINFEDQRTPPPLLNNSVLQFQSTTSSECWRICNRDDTCFAYVHLLDTNECYGYSYLKRSDMYMAVGNNLPLLADGEAVFYEKTCLKVPETCKQRLWTLTKMPGNSLVFQGKKTISTLVTRRECAERCLFEHEFQCLSASFAPSHRNNHERFIACRIPEMRPNFLAEAVGLTIEREKLRRLSNLSRGISEINSLSILSVATLEPGNGLIVVASRCPDDNCLSTTNSGSNWYPIKSEMSTTKRRRRRQATTAQDNLQQFKVQNPVYISTVMDVVTIPENDENNNYTISTPNETEINATDSIPLNFNLHVRGPDNTNTNSFIYGERGVLLIAGIDDQLHMESVCMNQSLLIALLIFWLIFQIGLMFSCCFVIQKYKRLAMLDEERRKIHESLEYLEGRRVHWADQGGYTL
ncbi:uncharacterized protein LOC133329251 [Musca vetustissima]|uniref:uncharacterized protein LOC133329251 n=1 Tax=Musca vetustissima TaxID=27455 RepID=UPI002AB7CA77|nr:uncharacterized protein LOC133329251 [Musca vetustissima]